MGNSVCFVLKALLTLKIFTIFVLRLITIFLTSQTGQQIIFVHILPNISRSKGNQTTKFGQLIEHNRNVFLEKLYAKYGEDGSAI